VVARRYLFSPSGDQGRWDREKSGRKDQTKIAHHEPIFHRNLLQDYANSLELVMWLRPAKAEWVRPHCAVASLLRAKP
jgi:hypothetical protein